MAPITHGSPTTAAKIEKAWVSANDDWAKAVNSANTPEKRELAISKRPKPALYINQMWKTIQPSLEHDWTLKPASWLVSMQNTYLPPDEATAKRWKEQFNSIGKSVSEHHIKSPKVIPMCIALAQTQDPRSLKILEKIESTNPDPKAQGVAALSIAMTLRSMGDDKELMQRRIPYLRQAIVKSSDIEINNTTVAQLAENELYIILHLSKGRVAPDISGTDSNNRPIQLSDYKGKVIVLLFWSSTIPGADRTIEITNAMVEKFASKPIEVIGVNHDPLTNLKTMQNNAAISWRNFSDPNNALAKEYRVGSWPKVYVLDQDRKIQYSGSQGTFAELTAEALVAK